MTSWAYNVVMGHRKAIGGYKLSKAEDDRLDMWTSVGYLRLPDLQVELYKLENFGWLVGVATDRPLRSVGPARM